MDRIESEKHMASITADKRCTGMEPQKQFTESRPCDRQFHWLEF